MSAHNIRATRPRRRRSLPSHKQPSPTQVYSFKDPGCNQLFANSTKHLCLSLKRLPNNHRPMGYSSNDTFNKSLSKVIYSPLEKKGRRQTAQLTFEGGSCSDIQLGHKNQGNARDILPENNKGGGRDCFLSLTAAVKHTQSSGLQQWPRAGEGG